MRHLPWLLTLCDVPSAASRCIQPDAVTFGLVARDAVDLPFTPEGFVTTDGYLVMVYVVLDDHLSAAPTP